VLSPRASTGGKRVTVELMIVAAENSPIEVSEAAGTDAPMGLSAIGVEHALARPAFYFINFSKAVNIDQRRPFKGCILALSSPDHGIYR